MSWKLPPEDLLDADYTPSLWTVQKIALMVLLGIVIGAIPISSLLTARSTTYRSLATAPRRRKPQITYPVKGLF